MMVLGFTLTSYAQARLSSKEIFEQACKEAKASDKKVFVIFTASWCGWCHRMDKSMEDEVCRKYFDENFVVIHFVVDESADKKDLETPGAAEFRTKYHGDGQGIPFWLVFDKEGNFLADSKMRKEGEGPDAGQNSGCPANEPEVAYFIDVLKRTTSLNADELQAIYKRFRQNEN
jgi:thiol-disulfide isomerase/thioredoxin